MIFNGTTYHDETSEVVVEILEKIRFTEQRIRLFYGDTDTGEAWEEENDVTGTLGISTGPVKVPLLLHSRRSLGGSPLLDHCIVAIKSKKRWIYQCTGFSVGKYLVHESSNESGYPVEVTHNGKIITRFHGLNRAQRYVDFMTGRRMTQ